MKAKRMVLFSDYTIPRPNATEKARCVQAATQALRYPPRSVSLWGQVKTQLAYTGPWFWLCLCFAAGLFAFIFCQIELAAEPGQPPVRPILTLFSSAGPMLAALSAPLLACSHTHSMWELEEASFHNLARLTALRMGIAFVASLPVLGLLGVNGIGATGLWPGLLALAVPFLLASGATYCVLGHLRGTVGSLCCAGACLLVGLACYFVIRLPQFPGTIPLLWETPALCIALAFFLFSARRLTHKGMEPYQLS